MIRYRGKIPNELIPVGFNSYEKVNTFKYLRTLFINQIPIHREIK